MNDVFIKIAEKDNVAVALKDLAKGTAAGGVRLVSDIPKGHKFALEDIKKDAKVIKYGFPIGSAQADIGKGEHIHSHNLKTDLSAKSEYEYTPKHAVIQLITPRKLKLYKRRGGEYGIRNELWVVPTVGCVNSVADKIVKRFSETRRAPADGAFAFPHPFGCSQTGCDHERTRMILKGIVKHPNAGGVLVLGLGCENNRLSDFKSFLGDFDADRIRFFNAQDVSDEIGEGVKVLAELSSLMKRDKREDADISRLKIGLKCGGSDGFSGITANPLLGKFADYLTAAGGTAALTEVPEMFGAEQLLMNRAENGKIFGKIVNLINGFKDYFIKSGQPVYENPSPGNKDGGITTLEEKSLGCIQKSGSANVADVVDCGGILTSSGLNLLNGPGNDIVATTLLGAAGCHMVLFATGRGTPLGGFVPVVKISSNDDLYAKKAGWIDFNAGGALKHGFGGTLKDLIELTVKTAEGRLSKSELNGARDIAIFKTGITL